MQSEWNEQHVLRGAEKRSDFLFDVIEVVTTMQGRVADQ
jgi:hypothetical protein